MTVSHRRKKPYRFGFILNTTVGNMTRYQNLRKYAERDDEVEFVWAPAGHYIPADRMAALKWLPGPVRLRFHMLQQAAPVLRQLNSLDAVMIHLYEADVLCALRSYAKRRPVRVSSTDEAPVVDRATYPLYPHDLARPRWRQKMRLAIDFWRVRHTDEFIPFSHWGADILVNHCGAPPDRVAPIHVGMDLDAWSMPERRARAAGEPLKMIFVGGDFDRKGGAMLLDVFARQFAGRAELHLVSRQAPTELPPDTFVYRDFHPNDPRLTALYRSMDVLVVPTTVDLMPWVFMEAMASGLATIGTRVGALPEMILPGKTGLLIEPADAQALAAAIEAFVESPDLGVRMGKEGRAHVEATYDAARNVPLILERMKRATRRQRAERLE